MVLTDILGVEDHLGDMDFKVAGTREGLTAMQMDIKIKGLSVDILREALYKAKNARLYILDIMNQTINKPRPDISPYAPRILTIKINPDKIRDIIGPGGKTIRKITEETNTVIDIEDDGTVNVASPDRDSCQRALDIIKELTREVQVGEVYSGKVKKVTNFGAFVEILPGQEGLVHISELDVSRIGKVEDICRPGDSLTVKVLGIDEHGKISLSRKATLSPKKSRPADGQYRKHPPRGNLNRLNQHGHTRSPRHG